MCGLNAELLLGARKGVVLMTNVFKQVCEICDFTFTSTEKRELCSLCLRKVNTEESSRRPGCDCDQSGSGFSLCSYCYTEQVGGDA